jgi:undecaprenyl-diphosphatase
MIELSEMIKALIIAIVQGLTEWLPVSSSGHLVLFERLLDYSAGGVKFDVALHFGTLMAVFVYFGGDIIDIMRDFFSGSWKKGNGRLGWMIIVGTIPAAIIGFTFKKYFEAAFSSLGIVAIGFAITGIILLIASMDFKTSRFANLDGAQEHGKVLDTKNDLDSFGYWRVLGVGFMQALAIFPGISRSGSTISSGLILGLKEREAIKFSFLLSVPAIFGAAILEIGNEPLPKDLIWATLLSFIVGLVTIHLLLNYILTSKKNLVWFAVYVLALAVSLGIYLIFL